MARRQFSEEFRQEAVELVLTEKYSVAEAGKRLGVGATTLRYWVKQHQARGGAMSSHEEVDLRKRVAQLEKENQRLLREREILKKAAAFFAKEQP